MSVSIERLVSLRRALAAARAGALQDAEDLAALLVAIEDVGAFYAGGYSSLKDYEGPLCSQLMGGRGQLDFQRLIDVVTWNRNTGVHAGAWARHATTNAVELALLLEEALGRKIMEFDNDSTSGAAEGGDGKKDQNSWSVEYFMVRDPVCAQPWHTVADVRRTMLRYSFGHLPIWRPGTGISPSGSWMLISSQHVATFLGSPHKLSDRRSKGAKTVEEALKLQRGRLELVEAKTLSCRDTWQEALRLTKEVPALVVKDNQHPEQVLGIVTAFDLM